MNEFIAKLSDRQPGAKRGFTLMELLVVMGIIITIVAISIPAVNTLTKGNSQRQAVNMVTAYIANARTIAMSTGRQAGVIFYEEKNNALTPNSNQTAVQLIVEDPNQSSTIAGTTYTPAAGCTTFMPDTRYRVEYLPAGIKVATLDDSNVTGAFRQAENSSTQSRVVMFNGLGQLVLRNGICRSFFQSATTYNLNDVVQSPLTGFRFIAKAGSTGQTPPNSTYWTSITDDWNVASATSATSISSGVSSPGLVVYNGRAFNDAGVAGNTANSAAWLQANADIVIVNAYTGNVIR